MSHFTALLDACVRYPAPLRDLFLHLAQTDLFRARWTEAIHDEWIRNLIANRADLSKERLERTRTLMNAAVPDCLVEGYKPLMAGLSLPDPDDRHVLAAAIRAGADVIVTFNLSDFPPSILGPFGIDALHPDDFMAAQFDLNPGACCAAVKRHRASLKKPPKTVEEYLATLEAQQLCVLVDKLRPFANVL